MNSNGTHHQLLSRLIKSTNNILSQNIGSQQLPPITLTDKENILLGGYFMNLLYKRTKRICQKYHNKNEANNNYADSEELMDRYLSSYLIQDLLQTGNFTLNGLAYEIRTPVDVIVDIASGLKINQSPALLHKLIKLHVITNKSWYSEIIKRILVVLGYW